MPFPLELKPTNKSSRKKTTQLSPLSKSHPSFRFAKIIPKSKVENKLQDPSRDCVDAFCNLRGSQLGNPNPANLSVTANQQKRVFLKNPCFFQWDAVCFVTYIYLFTGFGAPQVPFGRSPNLVARSFNSASWPMEGRSWITWHGENLLVVGATSQREFPLMVLEFGSSM